MDPVTEGKDKDVLLKIYQATSENYDYAIETTEIPTLDKVTEKVQRLYEEFHETHAVVVTIRKKQ